MTLRVPRVSASFAAVQHNTMIRDASSSMLPTTAYQHPARPFLTRHLGPSGPVKLAKKEAKPAAPKKEKSDSKAEKKTTEKKTEKKTTEKAEKKTAEKKEKKPAAPKKEKATATVCFLRTCSHKL